MSAVTGGFDVCVELTAALLTSETAGRIREQLPLDENQEFDLAVMIPGDDGPDLEGIIHLFVTSLGVFTMDANGEGRLGVSLGFRGSVLRIDSPVQDHASGLSGSLTLRSVPVQLSQPERNDTGLLSQYLEVNLSALQEASILVFEREELGRLMGRLGVDPIVATAAIEQSIAGALQKRFSVIRLERPIFRIAEGNNDGDLGKLRFVELDLASRASDRASRAGVMCVLGNIARSHFGDGSPERKTQVGTVGSNTGSAFLSAAALRDRYFCPAAFQAYLPAYLEVKLPRDFPERLPSNAFEHLRRLRAEDVGAFTDPDNAPTEATVRDALANAGDLPNATLFRSLFPDEPVRDLTPFVGPVITSALPAEFKEVLRDTRTAARRLMPPVCSNSEGLDIPYVRLVYFALSLHDGFLRLKGRADVTATGLDGRVIFEQVIRVKLDGEKLSWEPAGEPLIDSDVSVEWWAWVLSVIALLASAATGVGLASGAGFIALGIAAVAGFSITGAFGDGADGTLYSETKKALDMTFSQLQLPELPDDLGTPTSVAVTARHLGLQFTRELAAQPPPPELPSLELMQSEERTRTQGIGREVYIQNECVNGRFTVTDVEQQIAYTLVASTVQLDPPIRYEWTVEQEAIAAGQTKTFRPGTDFELTATLSSDGTQLKVTNVLGRGNFYAEVVCNATDTNAVEAGDCAVLIFRGRYPEYDNNYRDQVRRCLEERARDRSTIMRPLPAFGRGPIVLRNRLFDPVILSRRAVLRRLATSAQPLRR